MQNKELEALIMSEDSDASLVNILDQEPSTSRGGKRHSASGDDDVEVCGTMVVGFYCHWVSYDKYMW